MTFEYKIYLRYYTENKVKILQCPGDINISGRYCTRVSIEGSHISVVYYLINPNYLSRSYMCSLNMYR